MSLLNSVWRGEPRAWKLFWLWGVLYPCLLTIPMFIFGALTKFPLITDIFMVLYVPFWCVAMWRGAFNLNWTIFGYVCRLWVIFSVLYLPFMVIALVKGESMFDFNEDKLAALSVKAAVSVCENKLIRYWHDQGVQIPSDEQKQKEMLYRHGADYIAQCVKAYHPNLQLTPQNRDKLLKIRYQR